MNVTKQILSTTASNKLDYITKVALPQSKTIKRSFNKLEITFISDVDMTKFNDAFSEKYKIKIENKVLNIYV